MKYYKFEKIKKGENPIIRVTFRSRIRGLVVKDICRSKFSIYWKYMDNGNLIINDNSINTFFDNDEDVYWVNGQK